MANEIAEVVKQYVMHLGDLNPPINVKARISKITRQDGPELYECEFSHHYRPSESAASLHIPTITTCKSFEEAEAEMKHYMLGFTAIDVTPTKGY